MTRRAVLTAPAAGDPFARVAGMSVLLRQLLSLQDAGIEEVVVEGTATEQLPSDPRLRLRVTAAGRAAGRDGLLYARLGLVWQRLLLKRLVKERYAGDVESAQLTGDEFIIAASDAASRRVAEDRLLQSLLKATDGLISRTINRRISLRVTRMLLDTSLTPNQMTMIAAVFGVAAIVVVGFGGVPWIILGACLLQMQSILDGCDGEISRLKYIRSRLGEWLDQILDDLVNVGFFAVTGWALYKSGEPLMLPLTVAGTGLHLVYQVALYIALVTRGGGSGSVASIRWPGQLDPHAPRPELAPGGILRLVKETLEMAGRRDFFTFFYLPAALVGLPELAVILCGIIFILYGLTSSLQWLLLGGPRPVPNA